MIRISQLDLTRDGRRILKGINAQIPAAGLTAVIGPNGAGKSSLLHCMAGLLTPSAGTITIDGTDIVAARPANRARLIAMLPQGTPVVPRLSVADLVAFGRWPHHRGHPSAADHAIIRESMIAFDLLPLADRRLDSLSGGQRQRAFVAMAHAQSTPWLLLDEPLAALDPKYASDIMRRLHAMSRPGPDARGIVVVLHDLAMAARYADWVVSLKDGQLFASAPRREAMNGASLTALFDTEILVDRLNESDVIMVR